jgi:hypothetical protein
MASIQEPSLVRLYKQSPNGDKKKLAQARVEQLAPAGGAPDGAPASVSTPEKLLTINSPVVLQNDDVLLVSIELDSADGIDASDCIWSIPLVTTNGSQTLGRAQFTSPTFADLAAATAAGVEIFIAGYKVTESQARLSGKIYLDVQDDTA